MASRRGDAAEFLDAYAVLKRHVTALATQAYADHGLGTTQVRFLKHIANAPGISQADLSRATDTDPALTGRALATLIERGWVRRARSPEDRRAYVLQLGASGKRVVAQVETLRQQLADRVTAALDARDREDFKRVVSKIVAALAAG